MASGQAWEWNSEEPKAIDGFVHDLIEAQATSSPDQVAVASWDGELTYGQLESYASRLADHLKSCDVGPEVLVPICMQKSLWAVVCLVAVLKSGGAFVLLDVSLPLGRLKTIFDQTHAPVALTSPQCLDLCQELVGHNSQVLVIHQKSLDGMLQIGKHDDSWRKASSLLPSHAAYIIFTSGSTGVPKGVIIEHSQLMTWSTLSSKKWGLSYRARVLQFASYAFDACIQDLIPTLISGGTVCIPSDWERMNDLLGAMHKMRITHACLTPTVFQGLDNGNLELPPSLHSVMFGGEATPPAIVERWSAKIPRLVVAYGPSEATVSCTWADFSPGWRSESHTFATGEIGKPFGTRTWVIRQDDVNTLAEVGEVGELLLEGPFLARGYLNRPEATEAAFIAAPKWLQDDRVANGSRSRSERRVYRTGDLVRLLQDGCICYVGRIDSQVKIRGQRLELSEVEKHITDALASPVSPSFDTIISIKAIIVELVKLKNGVSPQLVTFLCLDSTQPLGCFRWERALSGENGQDVTKTIETSPHTLANFARVVSRITEHIRRSLPAYATPSVSVPLANVPLSVSNKIDRKQLRQAAMQFSLRELMTFTAENPETLSNGENGHASARVSVTDNEVKLAGLWNELFDLQDIGSADNFLVLGGESLSAMKLVAAARAAGLDLTMDTVLRFPVLSEMARHVGTLKPNSNESVGKEPDNPPTASLLPFTDDPERVAALFKEARIQCGLRPWMPNGAHIEDIFPASSLQAGLVLSYLKSPGAYMIQSVYQIPASARVDPERLELAWKNIVHRTPCLRSRFIEHDGEIYQAVLDGESPTWLTASIDQGLDRYLITEQSRRFKLGEPMSWLTLVPTKEGPNGFALVWTIHHALIDGWSSSLIISDLEEEYFRLGQNGCSLTGDELATTSPPFQRFIRHCIKQEKSQASKLFWKRNLEGTQAPSFPSCPSAVTPQATSVLEKDITISFKSSLSCTPATLVQAAWFLLLGIHSGEIADPGDDIDVVTGVTLNGRSPSVDGIENIAGPTITTVPFRMQISPNQSLAQYLQSVQGHYLSILPHEQVGLQNIRRLSPGAEAACQFQSLLVIQSIVEGAACLGTCAASQYRIFEKQTDSYTSVDYALNMDCELKPIKRKTCEGNAELPLFFRVIFDSQIIPEAKMRRLFVQLEHLIGELASAACDKDASPKKVITLLRAACAEDVAQIMEWNETLTRPRPLVAIESCVHDLITKQCRLSPELPAVHAWDGKLSYKKLDSLSSLLAVHLQHGYCVKPESLVLICFEKSMWTVVAMLAVLKAGGGCAPIDPFTPPNRLRAILGKMGDSFSGLVLTSYSSQDRFSALIQHGRILAVDQSLMDNLTPGAAAGPQIPSPQSTAEFGNAAFVVFTSGSTGTPKGIVLEHHALCSSAIAHGSFWGLGVHSRVLQFAAHTFDVSIGDMFVTLIHGGCVCIPSDHDRMNNLPGVINAFNVNHANLTPTVSAHLSPEEVPGLKLLANVGEALSKTVVEKWASKVELFNMYGPAECSIYAIIKGNIHQGEDPNNIGRGVGVKGWLVDPQDIDRLVPIGATGEILIEGPNLARGYLGDDEKTDKSFVWGPAWSRSNDSVTQRSRRFYRTGDLAVLNDDGSMTFVGRNDGQIKLRGQRLELGEIESQLHHFLPASTRLAAAAVSPKGEPHKMLLAVFISISAVTTGCMASVEEKKTRDDSPESLIEKSAATLELFKTMVRKADAKLKTVLPSYMMPSAYVPLATLPVSASGKTDRKQLRSLAACLTQDRLSEYLPRREENNVQRSTNQGSTSPPPHTKEESLLHRLWTGLFGLARELHVNDHFFRLGGDSMAAMRLVSLARQQGMTLTVEKIFRHPILKDLACVARTPPRLNDVGHKSSLATNNHITSVPAFSLLAGKDVKYLRSQAAQQCGIRSRRIQDIYPVLAIQERFMTGAFLGSIPDRTLAKCWQKVGPRDEQSLLAFSLPSAFDLHAFEAAWSAVVSRHPILRTRMIDTEDGILQVVFDEKPIWKKSNLSIQKFVEHEKANAMVFGDPLIRLSLVTPMCPSMASQTRTFFVLSTLHAIYDGFSFGKMWEEVETEYAHLVGEKTGKPLATPRRISTTTGLQMNQLVKQRSQADKAAAQAFWRTELLDSVTVPIVSYDRLQRRVLNKTRRRAAVDMQMNRLHVNGGNITLSTMIFVSAALTLSHDYGSPDIIFEALLSGRSGDIQGVEDVMGPAMTCVPVRIRLEQQDRDNKLMISTVLQETQTLLHERLVKHEHVGWWDLVQMDEFRDILKNVPQININPNPYLELGTGLGLTLEDSFSTNEVFYAMSSFMQNEKLVLMISSDDAYVDGGDVERHLRKWSTLLEGLLHMEEDVALRDFFACLSV